MLRAAGIRLLTTEICYVLDGAMEFLVDGELSSVRTGGLVVVPPGTVHAFGAATDGAAEADTRYRPFRVLSAARSNCSRGGGMGQRG
ncbi:cupin domain-containing protein [Nocardia sp. NPDC046473]|uniref:cupin domain-containing protein n=1 Tax=Nocardia sp. NPDC046473 TaxID=3155733 RepID=UPI0033F205E6